LSRPFSIRAWYGRGGTWMVTCGMRFNNSVCACSAALLPKWYHCPFMKGLPPETDFVVLGAGVAGLRAAIELAAAGRVLVLEKHGGADSTPSPTPVTALSDE